MNCILVCYLSKNVKRLLVSAFKMLGWNKAFELSCAERQTLSQTFGRTWRLLGCCMAQASVTGWSKGLKGFWPGDWSHMESSMSWQTWGCSTLFRSNQISQMSTLHWGIHHSTSLTAAPEAPALWPPVPSSPGGCDSAAPPVGPSASCSLFQRSSAGTHASAQAPPGNPDNAHPHRMKGSIHTWIAILDIIHLWCSV